MGAKDRERGNESEREREWEGERAGEGTGGEIPLVLSSSNASSFSPPTSSAPSSLSVHPASRPATASTMISDNACVCMGMGVCVCERASCEFVTQRRHSKA
jgi:hypothetical protein